MRDQRLEDLPLDGFLLRRRLDDQVAVAEVREARRRPDLVERLRLAELVDDPAPELPVEIVADPYDSLLQLLRRDVGQPHLAAREGGEVGDAVAHLSGAGEPDAL